MSALFDSIREVREMLQGFEGSINGVCEKAQMMAIVAEKLFPSEESGPAKTA